MDDMMADINKAVDEGKFDPMGYLERGLTNERPKGPSCDVKPYKAPSDDITSREG